MRHPLWLEVDPTPTPLPAYEGDPNLVTPGAVGFIVTFLIAAVTILLIIDMVRRIRRVRYREQVREQIASERAGEAGPIVSEHAGDEPATDEPGRDDTGPQSANGSRTDPGT